MDGERLCTLERTGEDSLLRHARTGTTNSKHDVISRDTITCLNSFIVILPQLFINTHYIVTINEISKQISNKTYQKLIKRTLRKAINYQTTALDR